METVHHHLNHDKINELLVTNEKYSDYTIYYLQVLYIIGAVFWIILCIAVSIYKYANWLIWCLLAVPIIIFAFNYLNLKNIGPDIEQFMLLGDYLSFGSLIIIVLVYWRAPISNENKSEFLKLIVTAFIILMLSLIDVWGTRSQQSIVRHVRSMLETMALILLAVALYFYFLVHQPGTIEH